MSGEMFEVSSAALFVPVLLLGLREQDSGGPELVQRMTDLGFGVSHPEAIDRALGQMEGEGLIFSEGDGSTIHCTPGGSRSRTRARLT